MPAGLAAEDDVAAGGAVYWRQGGDQAVLAVGGHGARGQAGQGSSVHRHNLGSHYL